VKGQGIQIRVFIDAGHLGLPKLQSGYGWNREQVCGLDGDSYRTRAHRTGPPPTAANNQK